MGEHEPITGTAAGVPFTALPPTVPSTALLVTWHMVDAPRTDAAFAAALPMNDVPAWRVHLGLPMCGARMVDGTMDALIALAQQDSVLAYFDPLVRQAADEFPAALAELRSVLAVDDGPIAVVGGSAGATVALEVLARGDVPIAAAALVNPAIRARSVVEVIAVMTRQAYQWTPEAELAADQLDFVRRAGQVSGPPILVVGGEADFPPFQRDAAEFANAVATAELVTVPGMGHALAAEPGMAPAPQTVGAQAVDAVLTDWFRTRLHR